MQPIDNATLMQSRQIVVMFEVDSMRHLFDTLNEYMLVGYIVMSMVSNKTHSEERGDYIEVLVTMIYPGGLESIEEVNL